MFGRTKKKADKGEKAAKKPKAKKEKKPKVKQPKPARKSKAPGVAVKKRPTDIYAVMLMVSLGFVAISCIFLTLELGAYGFGFGNFTPWK